MPIEDLECYGFDVFFNEDKGYKEYTLRWNGLTYFTPKHTYNAEYYNDYTGVYTTKSKVYLDSDIPANVYELENGTVLIQSDELAKYCEYR